MAAREVGTRDISEVNLNELAVNVAPFKRAGAALTPLRPQAAARGFRIVHVSAQLLLSRLEATVTLVRAALES